MKQICQCQNTFHFATSLAGISGQILELSGHKTLFYLDCFGLKGHDLDDLLQLAYRSILPHRQYALFNIDEDANLQKRGIDYCVRGFFSPECSPEDFCKGTRAILNGEVWVSRKMASELLLASARPPSNPPPGNSEADILSSREKEVLTHLASGANNEVIADKLCISPHTLRTHLNNIYHKINVHTRIQAVRWAEKESLINKH